MIALARAMLRQTKILILDEGKTRVVPSVAEDTNLSCSYFLHRQAHFKKNDWSHDLTLTSDYETDLFIQNSLRSDIGDATLIIIAHRLQTIMDADKIVSELPFDEQALLTAIIQMVLDAGRIVSDSQSFCKICSWTSRS